MNFLHRAFRVIAIPTAMVLAAPILGIASLSMPFEYIAVGNCHTSESIVYKTMEKIVSI